MCSDKYPNLEHKTNKHIYSVWKYNRKSVLDKFPTFNLHVVLFPPPAQGKPANWRSYKCWEISICLADLTCTQLKFLTRLHLIVCKIRPPGTTRQLVMTPTGSLPNVFHYKEVLWPFHQSFHAHPLLFRSFIFSRKQPWTEEVTSLCLKKSWGGKSHLKVQFLNTSPHSLGKCQQPT